MNDALAGTSAVVTGAGRGLGRAVAIGLAARGARVWAVDRTVGELDLTASLIHETGGRARLVRADLAHVEACREVARQVTAGRTRSVDVLVNNAAVLKRAPISEMSAGEWSSTLAVNLTAAFVLTGELLPQMREQGASVINVSSRAGVEAFAGEAAYCASKHGLEAFTRCLAIELQDAPVSANTITPGLHIKPTSLSDAEAEALPEPRRREWSDPAAIVPAFVMLAGLRGQVSGRRFDALKLSEALGTYGTEGVLARIEEIVE